MSRYIGWLVLQQTTLVVVTVVQFTWVGQLKIVGGSRAEQW